MKYSKGVYVTKHKIREDQNVVYQLYAKHNIDFNKGNFSCQYDSKTETCTCRKIPRRPQSRRHFSGSPRMVCVYHGSRSFTDIGVGSVKALKKRRIRRIYLPDTDDRGCGSDDLSSFTGRKNKPYLSSYYDHKKTSSKCVGGMMDFQIECAVSQKLSPITQRKSMTTSTLTSFDKNQIEIGNNTINSNVATTGTQFEIVSQKCKHSREGTCIETNPIDFVINSVKTDPDEKALSEETEKPKCFEQKSKLTVGKTTETGSSDSLVQHIHNLEDDLSYDKQCRSFGDPMENKIEKGYRRLFSTKNQDSFSKISVDKANSDLKSASVLKRRFEALRRGLTKKDEAKKTVPSSQESEPSRKDASITSDPPSLEGKTYTNPKKFNPVQAYAQEESKTMVYEHSKEKEWPQEETSSESQGAKGMFKLWGKKFDFEEETAQTKPKTSQNSNKNSLAIDIRTKPHKDNKTNKLEERKKSKRKFFFFKKKPKDQPHLPDEAKKEEESYKPSGVTAGRCEIRDGMTLKIGHFQHKQESVIPTSDSSECEDIKRQSWLDRFLTNYIESAKSVNVRWNNGMYATSSSTVFELMDTIYKNTGLVIGSRSEITNEASYNRNPKNKVNFNQKIEAWMIPKIMCNMSKEISVKMRSNNNTNVDPSITEHRWVIEKSRAFANKIEVVLHSNNYKRVGNRISSDYLSIEIPKDYIDFTSSDDSKRNPTSEDEEVYKIVEYESDMLTEADMGDNASQNINIVVSLQDSHNFETKVLETVIKKPPMHRDVVLQGSNVNIPKRCDVISVGIITERDVKDIRKSLLVVHDISDNQSDIESDGEAHLPPQKKCEFAESYLQEIYRHLQPVGIGRFPVCVSESYAKSGSEKSLNSNQKQGDGSKSCPNICDISSAFITCNTSDSSQYSNDETATTKSLKKIRKPIKAKTDTDLMSYGNRKLPKDSLKVFKRRKLYAEILKSSWASSEDKPVSVPSIESKGAQNSLWLDCVKCAKVKRQPFNQEDIKKKRNDHVKHARVTEEPTCVISPLCDIDYVAMEVSTCAKTVVPVYLSQKSAEPLPSVGLDSLEGVPQALYPPNNLSKEALKNFLSKIPLANDSPLMPTLPTAANLMQPLKQRRQNDLCLPRGHCGSVDCNDVKCTPSCCTPPIGRKPQSSRGKKNCRAQPTTIGQSPPPLTNDISVKFINCTKLNSQNQSVKEVSVPSTPPITASPIQLSPDHKSTSPAERSMINTSPEPTLLNGRRTPPRGIGKPTYPIPPCQTPPESRQSSPKSTRQTTPKLCSPPKSPKTSSKKCTSTQKICDPPCGSCNLQQRFAKLPTESPERKKGKSRKLSPKKKKCPVSNKICRCQASPTRSASPRSMSPPKPPCQTSPSPTCKSPSNRLGLAPTKPPKSPKPSCKKCACRPTTKSRPSSPCSLCTAIASCQAHSKSSETKKPKPTPVKSQQGISLKMLPTNKSISPRECPSNCTEQEVIRLNSCEDVKIVTDTGPREKEELRKAVNIEVKDCDGKTIFERKEYFVNGNTDCSVEESPKSGFLNEVLKDSRVQRISTSDIQAMNNVSTKNKKMSDSESNISLDNLLEIQLKLRISPGDKTTEINIGNEDEKKCNKSSHISQIPPEVFLAENKVKEKGTTKDAVEKVNPKHDINITIIIKNHRSQSKKNKLISKDNGEFSNKISQKFHTVSTGKDNLVDQDDDKVYSIHRTTVDLNSTEEKTSLNENQQSTELNKTDLAPVNVTLSHDTVNSITEVSEKTASTKNQNDTYDNLEYIDTTANEDLCDTDQALNEKDFDTDQDIVNLNTSDECSDEKLSTIEDKKELLKKVFEKSHKQPKNKENIRELRNMLKIILTDSSDNDEEGTQVGSELAKDVTYTFLKPDYFRNTDSMSNYYKSSLTLEEHRETPHEAYPSAEEDSISSDTDNPQYTGCMCSRVAKSLNCANGCCCKSTKIDKHISCHLLSEETDSVDVETQISKLTTSGTRLHKSRDNYIVQYKTVPLIIRGSHKDTDVVEVKTVLSRNTDSNILIYDNESVILRESSYKYNKCVVNNHVVPIKIESSTLKHKKESIQTSYKNIERVSMNSVPRNIKEFRLLKNTTATIGISDDDRIKQSKEAVKEKTAKQKQKREDSNNFDDFKATDVLQCYETKKAVLEIYAEDNESVSAGHLLAKLPKLVREKESEITGYYEHREAKSYKTICRKNLDKLYVNN